MRQFYFIYCILVGCTANAQRIDSLYFNLYTDSLKKGRYNYINVDGKMNNGNYLPLTAKEIKFESTTGTWDGNSLIIDSAYRGDSVIIKAILVEKPSLSKTITIYIKKSNYEGRLSTEDELYNTDKRKKRKGS